MIELKNWICVILILTIILGFGACSFLNKKIGQKDDWWGEELAEEVIKAKTGMDIDLSPE